MDKWNEEQKKIFTEGIERYKKKGIPVLIDDGEFKEEDYEKLIEVREDGSFYMGDFIETESGRLVEIHFDKVYHK